MDASGYVFAWVPFQETCQSMFRQRKNTTLIKWRYEKKKKRLGEGNSQVHLSDLFGGEVTSIWMVKGSLGKGRSLKNHEFQDDDSTKGLGELESLQGSLMGCKHLMD